MNNKILIKQYNGVLKYKHKWNSRQLDNLFLTLPKWDNLASLIKNEKILSRMLLKKYRGLLNEIKKGMR